jgi:DNA-binding response OmpR family regulator
MRKVSRGHVLLVDDERALLDATAEVLEAAGFSVEVADDGPQALRRIAARKPDVVVADVEMPGMDGYELCRRLRASGHEDIPFLFCSGRSTPSAALEGLRAGADDFIHKPASPVELSLKLRRQVDRVRALRTATAEAGRDIDAKALADIEKRLLESPGNGVPLGRFELREVMGQGSMGTVFKGWDTKLERFVAVKTVRAGVATAGFWDGDLVRRLVAEATMIARFNHLHVVTVYDVREAADAAYIVMEFVDGITLQDLIAHLSRLGPETTVPLLAALAGALAAAHAAHLVHRDVKPGNVLLGRDAAVKLTDFGIASFLSSGVKGGVIGTPGFLPPETLRGDAIQPSVDLFALGALAYRALAGRPAFSGKSADEILANTLKERVRPLRAVGAPVTPELEAMVAALLAPDPKDRITDAALLADELTRMAALWGWRWTVPDVDAVLAAKPAGRVTSGIYHAQLLVTQGAATRPV